MRRVSARSRFALALRGFLLPFFQKSVDNVTAKCYNKDVDKRYTQMEVSKMSNDSMMNKLNQIWKSHTGSDMTEEEVWKMVDFVKMIMENADKNLDAAIAK